MNQNQLDKPIATARQLYGLLDGVARSLQLCEPESESRMETNIRARVAGEIILLLEETGYPVSVTKIAHMGRHFQGNLTFDDNLSFEVKLATMFNESDYESVITAIQSILTEDVE